MVSLSQLYYTMVESRYVKHTLPRAPSEIFPQSLRYRRHGSGSELSSEFYGGHNTVGDKYLETVFIDKQLYNVGQMCSRHFNLDKVIFRGGGFTTSPPSQLDSFIMYNLFIIPLKRLLTVISCSGGGFCYTDASKWPRGLLQYWQNIFLLLTDQHRNRTGCCWLQDGPHLSF